MSSTQAKSTPVALKTNFFFRTSSFQKFKCSAVYQFQQVAGLKLSKSAIIELLETNINKARVFSQKALLSFYIGLLKLVTTLMLSPWVQVSTAKSTVDVCEKIEQKKDQQSERSFRERLQEKINTLQKHKSRIGAKKEANNNNTIETPSTPVASPATVTLQNDLISRLTAKSKDFTISPKRRSLEGTKFQEMCFLLMVHAGLIVMYLQILVLAIALNTTHVPFGLIFLFATLAIIGFILMQVVFVKGHKQERSEKSSPNKTVKRENVKDVSPERESRSKCKTVRPEFNFNSKTLSKVKLL